MSSEWFERVREKLQQLEMIFEKVVVSYDTTSVDFTPVESFCPEKSANLIFVNQQAVDSNDKIGGEINNQKNLAHLRNDKPLPSIHVWQSEDDSVCIDNKCVERAIPLKSVVAWQEQESNDPDETVQSGQNPMKDFLHKTTLMAHERTPLFNHRHHDVENDVELDTFTNSTNKSRTPSSKHLLASQVDRIDRTSLSSLEDNRDDESLSFSSSQLVVSDDNVFKPADEAPTLMDDGEDVISNPHSVQESRDDSHRGCESRLSERSRLSCESRLSGRSSRSSTCQQPEQFELEERSSNENIKYDDHNTSETEFQLTEGERVTEEDTDLLHQQNEASMLRDQDNMSDNESVSSDSSEFLGSLGIYAPPGTWQSDLRVDLDLQLGREEWETSIVGIEGEASLEGWNTSIYDIAKSKARPEDWKVSLQEISDSISLKSDWSCSISESLLKKDVPGDWRLRFNKIEKLTDDRRQWRTMFRKIKERIYDKNEWKFKFNTISNRKNPTQNDWKFNLTNKFDSNNNKATDWGTRFNKLGSVTLAEDDWRIRKREMLVKSDDRSTHWNTKFSSIQHQDENENTWQTKMHKIEPIPEDQTWETQITKMSNDLGSPGDWNIKFIDIESNEHNSEMWAVEMNDVPDTTKHENDWMTKFQQIEELNDPNASWDTSFPEILEKGDEGLWVNKFNDPKIPEDTWEMKFNPVLLEGDRDLDWQVALNHIEGAVDGEETTDYLNGINFGED